MFANKPEMEKPIGVPMFVNNIFIIKFKKYCLKTDQQKSSKTSKGMLKLCVIVE